MREIERHLQNHRDQDRALDFYVGTLGFVLVTDQPMGPGTRWIEVRPPKGETGLALFTLWNLGTLAGALATHALSNPKVLGLDAAPPAAFLALLAPRLRAREPLAIAIAAAVLAIAVLPFVPAGVPLLVVAVAVAFYGMVWRPA